MSVRKINEARLAFYRIKGREPRISPEGIGHILYILESSGRYHEPEHIVNSMLAAEKIAEKQQDAPSVPDKAPITALYAAFLEYMSHAPLATKGAGIVSKITAGELCLRKRMAEIGLSTYIEWDK